MTVTVRNSGDRSGSSVVQVYVHDASASIDRPAQELKGFAKVHLDPDESASVTITLDTRAFAYWSVAAQDWAIEPGDYEIRVGFSSRDIATTDTITLAGNVGVGTLDAMSTIGEWLAHPVGSAVLGAAMAAAGDGAQAVSPEMMALAGSMPLGKLATFGLGITEEQVEQLVAAAAQPAS